MKRGKEGWGWGTPWEAAVTVPVKSGGESRGGVQPVPHTLPGPRTKLGKSWIQPQTEAPCAQAHDVLHVITGDLNSLKPQIKNSVPWNSKKHNNMVVKAGDAEVSCLAHNLGTPPASWGAWE